MHIAFEFRFVASLVFATLCFAALGFLVYQKYLIGQSECKSSFPGFLTCTLIGQLTALCLFYILSLPLRLLSFTTGITPILIHTTWWFSVVGCFAYLRKRKISFKSPRIRGEQFILLAVFFGILIPTAISFCSTLGGTGHDNHQHAFWSYHIVNSGYLPINARFTEIIEAYPKAFHSLVAIWLSPGIITITGPLVRIMPLLQSLLAIGALIEIFHLSLKSPSQRYIFIFFAIVGYCWLFVTGTTLILPFPPYNEGTPRFAAACVLYIPLIFSVTALVHRNKKMHSAALLAAPISFTLSTAFNPVFSLLWLVSVFPPLAFTWWYCQIKRKYELSKSTLIWLGLGVAVSFFVVIQDGWFLTQILDRSSLVRDALEKVTGLMTIGGAVQRGLLPSYTPTIHGEVAPDIGFMTLIYNCAVGGFWLRVHDSSLFPFIITPFFGEKKALYVSVLKFSFWILCATSFWGITRKNCVKDEIAAVSISAFILFMVGFGNSFTASILQLTQNKASHFRWLLGEYAVWSGYQLSALPYSLLSLALIWGVVRQVNFPNLSASLPYSIIRLTPLVLGIISAIWVSSLTIPAIPVIEGSPRGVLKEEDINVLRKFEKLSSPDKRIILPVNYTRGKVAAEEKWIGAGAHESAVLYSHREVLFNTFLGAGYTVSWNAVRKYFCTSDLKRRAKFIRERRISKIYFWDTNSGTKEYYDSARICGISLPKIGIKYPPIASENGHTLYEVIPPTP